MNTLILTSLITFAGGITAALLRYGMTRSISAIYDELEKDPKAKGWWFTVWQWAFCLPLMIVAIHAGGIESHLFSFAALLIMFSAYLGDTDEHEIIMNGHVGAAVSGIILAAMAMLFTPYWFLAAILVLVT